MESIAGEALFFTTVTAKLEACTLAVDLSVLPPAKLVPTVMAKQTGTCRF